MTPPPLFTTITEHHWRQALPMARARRRERKAALARTITTLQAKQAARAVPLAKGGRS